MKKVLLAAATVALLFATSCKNDVNAPENIQLGENEFLATIDNGAVPQNAPTVRDGMNTMTTIDSYRRVFWQAGDEIDINGVGYKAKTTDNPVVFEPETGSMTASQGTDGKYHAFYPASIAGTGNAGTLPAEQIYNGVNNVSNLPMYACSTTKELTFHNICAVLKIVVPTYFAGATKIEVSSDQRMNGDFTVDGDYKAVMTAIEPSDAEKKVTIRKSDNTTFTKNEEVYIAVPAGNYTNFTVAAINGDGAVLWDKTLDECELEVNKIYPINITYNGLCFTAAENNVSVTFSNIPTLGNGSKIQYSTNGTTWQSCGSVYSIPLANEGDKVYFRASKAHNTAFYGANFKFSGAVKASGNIMSLYGPDCSKTDLPASAFYGLFANCGSLQTAPKLPATTLAINCYDNMFYECVSLQTAPELPATELATNCYQSMFSSCSNLQTAPELPATTLVGGCYANMFEYCDQLNEVWIYATDVSAEDCLSGWLLGAGAMVPTCTVHCKSAVKETIEGTVPTGWTVQDDLQ